eukprot:1162013-Pelagomonas_calceolata.AAC.1
MGCSDKMLAAPLPDRAQTSEQAALFLCHNSMKLQADKIICGQNSSRPKWIHAKQYKMNDLYDLEAEEATKPKPTEPSAEEF